MRCPDDLNAAKGIVWSMLLGVAIWLGVALGCYYLIP